MLWQPWKPEGTLKARLENVRFALETTRNSFISHWQEIADYIRPRAPRFLVTDVNQGDKRSSKIINSAATGASNILAAGMLSGITSPARQWFALRTGRADLDSKANVKEWLYDSTQKMLTALGRTNFYTVMQTFYRDLGDFGTSAIFAEEDLRRVAKFKSLPIGSYTIARDQDGNVYMAGRRFMYTARQIKDEFGVFNEQGDCTNMDDFSMAVQGALRTGGTIAFEVVHIILPNDQYVKGTIGVKGKKFLSVYYELGASNRQLTLGDELFNKYLRVAGFNRFPVFVGVWARTGEDDYGTSCPGMDTLSDIKQLQQMERRGAKALEKMIDPPMQGPTGVQKQQVSMLPGSLTVVAGSADGRQALTPLHETRVDLGQLREDKMWIIDRIDENYFKKMFLMQIESEREMTAREVDERSNEKLLVLGPVLEQLNLVLDQMIGEWFFDVMLNGPDGVSRLLPPPTELYGVKLEVQYLSVNTQAQKALGLSSVDRLANSVIAYASVDPTIIDAVNPDKLASSWGDFSSSPPGVVRTQDQIDAIRAQRQQAIAAQQQAEAAALNATAAQKLASSDTSGQNALTDLIKQAQAGQPAGVA